MALRGGGSSGKRHAGFLRKPTEAKLLSTSFSSGSFLPIDLTVDIVHGAEELYMIRERGDRLIAATVLFHDLPLLTRDPALGKAAGIDVIW